MTLAEWTATLMAECAAEGWTVRAYPGGDQTSFPLVTRPEGLAEGVRFLKHRFSLPVERSIYAEGCLLLPPGSQRMRQL